MLKNLGVVSVLACLLSSCSYQPQERCSSQARSSSGRQSAAEVDRQIEKYSEQQARVDQQQARVDAQMKRVEEQQKRMESLITRWEAQADRYDAILSRWEKEAPSRK